MLRRPFCGMAAGFLLGIVFAAYGEKWLGPMILGGCLVGAVLWFLWKQCEAGKYRREGAYVLSKKETVVVTARKYWGIWIRIGLILLAVFLGWQRYTAEQRLKDRYLPYLEDNMQLFVQGKLAEKEILYNQYIYELTSCMIQSDQLKNSEKEPVSCNRILIYSDSDFASIGEILVLEGKVELWSVAVNEGNFDAKSFYEARKIDFKLKKIRVKGIYGKENRWREGLWQLKEQLKDVYATAMGEETGGILVNMVLGDKELLGQDTKRLYQVAGLSHIMAISGLHISVIGMSLYQFLRRRGLGFIGAGAVVGTVMYMYGIMVGMSTSAQRAVIMFFLQLIAQVLGRAYDSLNGLGVAALVLLWRNPFLLWDAGFRFSFAAVIGVVWIGKLPEGQREKKKWEEKLFPGVAIQLTTLPLAAWYYYEIPIYAIAVNLVVLPVMGVLLTIGVLGGLVGLVSGILATVVLFPCKLLLGLSTKICSICAGLPGAMLITGKPEWWRMLLYYGLLALVTLYFQWKSKKEGDGHDRAEQRSKENLSRCKADHGSARVGRAVTGISQYLCGFILFIWLLWPAERGFELDALDVGQGDGCYLRTESGYQLFVDGGSLDESKVGEYRIMPFLKAKGVGKIDYWFVSHTDTDHISGLMEVLEAGYQVEHLVLSAENCENVDLMNVDAANADTDEMTAQLLALAKQAGAELVFVEQGDVLHLGEAKITILSPATGAYYADKNAVSLVFLYEEGTFLGIFTGDIDAATEQKILAEWEQGLVDLDFYKAAHHGSKYSNSAEFLMALRPMISVVSCGADNSYGHPSAEAVAHMEDVESKVFYTMEAGQIKVTQEKEGFVVQKYLEKGKKCVVASEKD